MTHGLPSAGHQHQISESVTYKSTQHMAIPHLYRADTVYLCFPVFFLFIRVPLAFTNLLSYVFSSSSWQRAPISGLAVSCHRAWRKRLKCIRSLKRLTGCCWNRGKLSHLSNPELWVSWGGYCTARVFIGASCVCLLCIYTTLEPFLPLLWSYNV